MKPIKEQFQIGDSVLLVHEGVVTQVSGYVWEHSLFSLPVIKMYQLTCGVSVPKGAIEVWWVPWTGS